MIDAVLSFDEGPGCGLGHRRRMEALAAALAEMGLTPVLRLVDDIAPAEILVIDSYRVRADDARFQARVVAAVDDLERNLAVDLLIDPNPGGDPTRRRAAGTVLSGLKYALVSPPLSSMAPRPVAATVGRVLVTSGAADHAGWGASVAAAMHVRMPAAEIRLVVGPWSAETVPDGVEAIVAPDGLVAELADADLVITAGGVTLLEALLLGRPTVAVATAGNQARAVRGVGEAGAAVALDNGTAPDDVSAAASALALDLPRRSALAETATALIDGQGPFRVAEALVAVA